jgi:hypothetical protein
MKKLSTIDHIEYWIDLMKYRRYLNLRYKRITEKKFQELLTTVKIPKLEGTDLQNNHTIVMFLENLSQEYPMSAVQHDRFRTKIIEGQTRK